MFTVLVELPNKKHFFSANSITFGEGEIVYTESDGNEIIIKHHTPATIYFMDETGKTISKQTAQPHPRVSPPVVAMGVGEYLGAVGTYNEKLSKDATFQDLVEAGKKHFTNIEPVTQGSGDLNRK